jgi:hypothetical protein
MERIKTLRMGGRTTLNHEPFLEGTKLLFSKGTKVPLISDVRMSFSFDLKRATSVKVLEKFSIQIAYSLALGRRFSN